ncbi:MAG: fused DSP-PTPase phosphatase/NAD kinase-like protein [Caulobacteraceae bacterium]
MTRVAKDRASFDVSTLGGRLRAYADFFFRDYSFLRVIHPNAHWIGPDLVRTAQPWPFQLAVWKRRGIRTVINLRGEPHKSHHVIEADACQRLGLTMVDFLVYSREAPTPEAVAGAKRLFQTIEYPALMHCKSGADRAGLMGVLYRHVHLGEPLDAALEELSFRKGHVRHGLTGVLDYVFRRYRAEAEPKGESLLEWVAGADYDPAALKRDFKASWWGTLLTEKLLRRE